MWQISLMYIEISLFSIFQSVFVYHLFSNTYERQKEDVQHLNREKNDIEESIKAKVPTPLFQRGRNMPNHFVLRKDLEP